MSLTKQVLTAIRGAAYIPETSMRDYHRACAIVNARRCKDANDKLMKIREALNQYRVSAWLCDNGRDVRLVRDGRDILVI